MPLYEISHASLRKVDPTSFISEHFLERADLQRLLREHLAVLVEDVKLVAEEFSVPNGTGRRIDLLGVDRDGHLVVVELKRTDDGGHLELQSLRYAAMVSAMTFDDLVDAHESYLRRVEPHDVDEARSRLATWLSGIGGEDAVLSREVRIVLASAGFDPEITTTVLWLTELYGLDISCVRLIPYKVGEQLVLDVQQLIPLPEAADLMVQLRRRESRARAAGVAGSDWTRYVIVTPTGRSEPLRKRSAIMELVLQLHLAGVSAEQLSHALPKTKFLGVDGDLEGAELADALVGSHAIAEHNLRRWFLESPIHDGGRTWVVSKMWGTDTTAGLDALLALVPAGGYSYEAVPRGE